MKHKIHTVTKAETSAENRNLSYQNCPQFLRGMQLSSVATQASVGFLVIQLPFRPTPMLLSVIPINSLVHSAGYVWNRFFGLTWEPCLAWTDISSCLPKKGHTTVILGTCCIIHGSQYKIETSYATLHVSLYMGHAMYNIVPYVCDIYHMYDWKKCAESFQKIGDKKKKESKCWKKK